MNTTSSDNFVWVFTGNGSNLSSAIFTELGLAENWIHDSKVNGVLTMLPLNTCVYDWAISNGGFVPKNTYQTEPEFIQRFSNASSLEHYHYENGVRCS